MSEAAALLGGAPGKVALVEASTGARVTYGELAGRVEEAAAAMADEVKAFGGGGPAFVFASNDVATVVALLAGMAAKVPVAMFDPRMPDDVMDELRRRYRPTAVRGVRTPVEGRGGPFDSATASTVNGGPFDSGLADARPTLRVSGKEGAEVGLLLSTSGSTGSPKLVRLATSAVIANAKAIAEALAIDDHQVAPTSLPIHYSYGLSVLTSHLVAGATVMLTNDGLLTDAFWTACREHNVTSLAGVPYSYLMLRRIDLAKLAPKTLTTFTQAGGKLDPILVRHYHGIATARGGTLYVMYGQTEATARIAVLPPAELPARAGSVGKAIPGGAITIDVDGDDSPLTLSVGARSAPKSKGEVGEVVYRGPNVMLGYATSLADLTRGDELGGELRTGDLGYLDDDGFLWITGRSRRIAKVFGLRLNLDELEALARAAAPGLDLAALGDGDRVAIFIAGADAPQLQIVRQAIVARLGIHPTGVTVTGLSSLPRLASGKIDYRSLEVPP